ncbi:MAG: transcriptional repressor [Fidelibacterota bacterium]
MKRYSKQRELVLEIVLGTNSHPTADWIFQQAKMQMRDISLGTVYRNLNQLVENSLILAHNINGVVHYDGFIEDHQHFYCTSCKKLYDVSLPVREIMSVIEEGIVHTVKRYEVRLEGTCSSCQ